MIDRLHVVGPVRGTSGHDRHTRGFVEGFLHHGVAVQLTHLPGWSGGLAAPRDERWERALAAPVGARTTLHFAMPWQVVPQPGRRNVSYTMFECARIPDAWARCSRRHDLVVLPTRASRDAWAAGGVASERLRVAPLGVDAGFFAQPSPPLPLATAAGAPLAERRTRFLTVAELRPRKNLLALLRVWIAATRAGDDTALILKLSAYQPHALERFVADVRALEAAIGRRLHDAAPVVLLAERLSDEQLRALYATATHYVSLSHGEGWDLPMTEAAVAGLQLVAPRHSAYVEWLREEEATFVPARLAPCRCEGRTGAEDAALFAGLEWWDPDEQAAAQAIRAIVGGHARETVSPARRIAREHCWERSAQRLLAALATS